MNRTPSVYGPIPFPPYASATRRYRAVFNTMLPDATQIADPFQVIKLANSKLDECRRRVQNETLGHRGRKTDPLYHHAAAC